MKKIIFLCLSLVMGWSVAHADEGMWLLKLMKQQHLEDSLRKAGLQLSPEALYSETSSSLRECIGIFGGGCTGEVVSPDGLILTNHHCGFSFVHAMSGIGHDYMKDGYFAKNRSEELRTPASLGFTFVLRVVDVTDDVNAAAAKDKADVYTAQSQAFLEPLAQKLFKKSDLRKKKGMSVRIVPFFGANCFYMFYEQRFDDIRLVANPPYNIGQFGGNSDNWVWPRHSADFAMFRIYADKNGDPAPYSPDNVPLKCKKYLPISLDGVKNNDYTMIMGFPGRTSRFFTASQVELRTQSLNAPIALAGNPLLDYYKKVMDQSDELRLMVEDDYFSWGNSIKNYGGMNEAVEKIDLVGQKKKEEERFRVFARKSGKPEYLNIIERLDSLCSAAKDTIYEQSLARITLYNQDFLIPVSLVKNYADAVRNNKAKNIEDAKAAIMTHCRPYFNAKKLEIEHKKMKMLLPYFLNNHKLRDIVPSYLTNGQDWEAFYDKIYTQSVFADSVRLAKVLSENDVKTLTEDPLYQQRIALMEYGRKASAGLKNYEPKLKELEKIYVRGLCEMYDWSKAPDANFTLRMTYGHVTDLKPRDAVNYDWQTVLDGMFEKESKTESDYYVNEDLRKLYLAKDFGRYARKDGKLPTCFLSNNDITGGNSGSGVLNARGELIGLAFDGNIESLSSDLKFNPALQRCINVDIRYVLFVIEKLGGCKYVFDELDIR